MSPALLALGVPGALIAGGALAGALAKRRLRSKYPPPGTLVDVGGRRLHLVVPGDGGADRGPRGGCLSGIGAVVATVQDAVAEFTTVCVYDRAGYGWSDPGPEPRTPAVLLEELRTLLQAAELAPPYVVVGHSTGGLLARLWAYSHPDEVAGMVLVDAAHENQMERFPKESVETVDLRKMTRMMGALAKVVATGILALWPSMLPLQAELPPQDAAVARALVASSGKAMATLVAEMQALEESQAQVRAARTRSLPDVPLIVLSHGKAVPLPRHPAITPEVEPRYEEAWQELQVELAGLLPRGERIVAEDSGHNIQLDQPDLVADAIRRGVASIREAGGDPR